MKEWVKSAGILAACLLSFTGGKLLTDHLAREQMSREIERWNEEEWKQNLIDDRVREFMDQMERKHS